MELSVGGGVDGRCVVVPGTSVCDVAKVLLLRNAGADESTVLSMLPCGSKRSSMSRWTL